VPQAGPPEGYPTLARFTIIMLLLTDPDRSWTHREIEEKTGIPQRRVSTAIQALSDSARVARIGAYRNGAPCFQITNSGLASCFRWISDHISQDILKEMRRSPEGGAIADAYMQNLGARLEHKS